MPRLFDPETTLKSTTTLADARRERFSTPHNPPNATRHQARARPAERLAASCGLVLALCISGFAQSNCLCNFVPGHDGLVPFAGYVYGPGNVSILWDAGDNADSVCTLRSMSVDGRDMACGGTGCSLTSDPPLDQGQHSISATCEGPAPCEGGQDCGVLTAHADFDFTVSTIPIVVITTAPVEGAILGPGSIRIGGKYTSLSPSTIAIQGVGTTSPDGWQKGQPLEWSLDIDSTTLPNLPVDPVTHLTTIGVFGFEHFGWTVSFSSMVGNPARVDPDLARHVYVDYTPPDVYIRPLDQAAKKFDSISGTAFDAHGTDEVDIALLGSVKYWDGTSFSLDEPHYFKAAGTENWSYPFSSENIKAGGKITVLVKALDSVGNQSPAPVTTDFNLPPPITTPPVPAVNSSGFPSEGIVVFDKSLWYVQYGPHIQNPAGVISRPFDVLCAHSNLPQDQKPSILDLEVSTSKPERLFRFVPTINAGCEYAWTVESSPDKCSGDVEHVTVKYGKNLAGGTDIKVLLPDDSITLGKTRIDGVVNENPDCRSDPNNPNSPIGNCLLDKYSLAFTRTNDGADAMNLLSQPFIERVTPLTNTCQGVAPSAQKDWEPLGINNSFFDYIGPSVDAFINGEDFIGGLYFDEITRTRVFLGQQTSASCTITYSQYFEVNRCRVPRVGSKTTTQTITYRTGIDFYGLTTSRSP